MPSLSEGLQQYQKQGLRSFHTPGHKGRREFFFNLAFPDFDLTELPGLDVLHAPDGIIREAQERCAEIFGAEESFFLVNGGTVGNQAMMMALHDKENRKVLVERQAHRSVVGALVLAGLKPDYIEPVIHPDFNLPLGTFLPRSIQWENYLGCQLTYPTYYGTLPPLGQWVGERDRKGAKVPLLVDQAHGSHYLNGLFPPSALKVGADLVLNSAHKTLSALTQGAILHVQGNRVDRRRLRQSLELLQSSSPNYLLLSSLEMAGEFALQEERWSELNYEVKNLHDQVANKIRLLGENDAGTYGIGEIDWSKILINVRSLGLNGAACADYLRREHGLEPEFWDQENILFLLGIGNTAEDVAALRKGLEALIRWAKFEHSGTQEKSCSIRETLKMLPIPPQKLTPREAFLASKKSIPLRDSLGKICGETISPYPPGIPWIVAGEEITYEVMEALQFIGDRNFLGWQGKEERKIQVVEEG